MQRQQQHHLAALRASQTFLGTHSEVLGDLKGTEAGKQLDSSIEQATAHELDRATAVREFDGSANQVKHSVDDLKGGHMTPLAKYARANLRGVPDFKALSHVPRNVRGPALVGVARAMATAALPYANQFEKALFPAQTVQELASAADALDTAFRNRLAAAARKVVAKEGVRQALIRGREAVAMLDPIVTKRLAAQPELLAGWRSAKRVHRMPQFGVAPGPVEDTGSSVTPVAAVSQPKPETQGVPSIVAAGAAVPGQEVKAA